jgi:hypothetical protein
LIVLNPVSGEIFLEAITDKKVFVYIIEKSMSKMRRILCSLLSILMLATLAVADGVAPEEAPQQPEVAEKMATTPAQTSAAASKSRQAVVPPPKPVVSSLCPPEALLPLSPKRHLKSIKKAGCLAPVKESVLLSPVPVARRWR